MHWVHPRAQLKTILSNPYLRDSSYEGPLTWFGKGPYPKAFCAEGRSFPSPMIPKLDLYLPTTNCQEHVNLGIINNHILGRSMSSSNGYWSPEEHTVSQSFVDTSIEREGPDGPSRSRPFWAQLAEELHRVEHYPLPSPPSSLPTQARPSAYGFGSSTTSCLLIFPWLLPRFVFDGSRGFEGSSSKDRLWRLRYVRWTFFQLQVIHLSYHYRLQKVGFKVSWP